MTNQKTTGRTRGVTRYAAGHALTCSDRVGRPGWRVSFPGQVPVPFATKADAVGYAERVQREADRRERRRVRKGLLSA